MGTGSVNDGVTAICTLSRTRLGALRTHARLAHETIRAMFSPVPRKQHQILPLGEKSAHGASSLQTGRSSNLSRQHNSTAPKRRANARSHGVASNLTEEKSAASVQIHSFGISGTSSGSRSSGCLLERLEGLLTLGTLPERGEAIECGELGRLLFRDCILLGAMYWSPWTT